jgi:type III pantothenate kinase
MSEKQSKPLLAVDIGNTSIALGLFASPEHSELQKTAKIALSSKQRGTDFLSSIKRLLGNGRKLSPFDAIVSSVVPTVAREILPVLRAMADRTILAGSRLEIGFILAVDNPKAVGTDRIVNTVAALNLVGSTVAVVDCGSATTISLLNDKVFLGGAILPGVRMMRDALRQKTAKLPLVPLAPPPRAIGANTSSAIQSGILIGTVEAVTGIIHRSEQERGVCFTIILTGGHAALLLPLFQRQVAHMPDLTLQGLRLLFHANA